MHRLRAWYHGSFGIIEVLLPERTVVLVPGHQLEADMTTLPGSAVVL
jgi:hypothetical protein